MPRNGAGVYTVPAIINPVVAGTTIADTWANPTMTDLASGVTDSLDRYGRGTMLAVLGLVDGSAAAPGVGFSSETTTGLYRAGAGTLAITTAGVLRASVDTNAQVTAFHNSFYPRFASQKNAVGTWYIGGDGAGANTSFQISLNALAAYFAIDSAGASTFQNAGFFPRLGMFRTAVGTWYVGGDGAGVNNNFQVSLNATAAYLSISSATGLTSLTAGLTVTGTTTSTAFAGPLTGAVTGNVVGNLTGNVAGNVSGSSGSTTGNAATATALQNARTIGGTSFDGTANIAVALAAAATALANARTIGGTSFDGTANIAVALAATATALAPGANINGVAFTGAGNITVTAAAGTLSGATLNATVTASSLTSAGATFNLVGGAANALAIGGNKTQFESAETACPSGTYTDTAVAHGGPRVPDIIQVVLRCKTIEAGFAVGDEINMQNDIGDAANQASQTYANATNIGIQIIRSGANPPAIRHKTTGVLTTLTAGNWKLVYRAHWL